ncbi:class I adenylate-forming enzyme family protein [Nocardia sp. NPDC057353]|uniref:class I adenylate-forming enzyme family protein n=1 Tax=Nocardia sp. NPDC057353 TaxID=3346104 RepID=UPI0036259126
MSIAPVPTDSAVPGWVRVVAHQARVLPELLALTDERGAALTYAALDAELRRAAGYWRAAGVGAGDPVAVLGRNSTDLVVTVLGLSYLGAHPLLLNWRLTPGELAELGTVGAPVAIAHDPEFAAGAEAVVPAGPRTVLGADRADGPPGEPAGDETFALLHTSGTTGLPKVIGLTYAAHLHGCGRLVELAGLGRGDVHLRFTPLFHLAGLQELGASLLSGGTTHLQAAFDPERWIRAVAERGVHYGHLPPATLRRVVDALAALDSPPELGSLREVWYGTAPAGPDLVARAIDLLGCDLRQVYGMTEAQSPVAMLLPEHHRDPSRLGTAGKPLPEWEIRLRGPDGTDVGTGVPGELVIRGPRLFAGYRTPTGEPGVGLEPGGWYATGDIAVLDDDGFLTIVDRAKDMVVSGGENVYPAEVERVLVRHPQVEDAAVIGVPHAEWGEAVHAVLIPRAGSTPDPTEFLAWCREHIAGFKRPRSIEFVDELPRNAGGKVLKRELRRGHWAGHTRGVS